MKQVIPYFKLKKAPKLSIPFMELGIGQAMPVKTETWQEVRVVRSMASDYAKRYGRRFSVRQYSDTVYPGNEALPKGMRKYYIERVG